MTQARLAHILSDRDTCNLLDTSREVAQEATLPPRLDPLPRMLKWIALGQIRSQANGNPKTTACSVREFIDVSFGRLLEQHDAQHGVVMADHGSWPITPSPSSSRSNRPSTSSKSTCAIYLLHVI